MQIYATVKIDGKEYRATPGRKIKIDRLDAKPGDSIEFADITQLVNGEQVADGRPTVKGALVRATVVKHGQEKGVIVFKMNRRRKYRTKKDREWEYSVIKVDDVVLGDAVFGKKDIDPKKIKKAQAAEIKKARAERAKKKPVMPPPVPVVEETPPPPTVAQPVVEASTPTQARTESTSNRNWAALALLLLGLLAVMLFFLLREPMSEAVTTVVPATESVPSEIELQQTGQVDQPLKPKQPPR
jgi:large subunit ribosomal protein L21